MAQNQMVTFHKFSEFDTQVLKSKLLLQDPQAMEWGISEGNYWYKYGI
jgi:hypothetical protein